MRNSEIKFGIGLPHYRDFNSLTNYALASEEAGLDSIWMADHVFCPLEALTTLTAIAIKTKKPKLGTCILDVNRRNPAIIAHMATTLDIISEGRLILGVGKGVWNDSTYGYRLEKPVDRMCETIKIIKKFWTEQKVNHKGKFFTYEDASIDSKPVQKPHPPVWIAGFGPKMLRIAGELGDGFITQHSPPEIYKEELEKVRKKAKEIGVDPTRIRTAFAAPMAISPDRHTAQTLIESGARRSLVRRASPPLHLATRLGYGAPWTRPEDVPLEVVDSSFIYGTPSDCVEKVEKYVKAGVEYFIPLPLLPEGANTIRLYAEEVRARFKEEA